MLARLASMLLLAAPALAQHRDLPADLSAATGLSVVRIAPVESQHIPSGAPGPRNGPGAEADPRRFRGLAVFLGHPERTVRVVRLVFADPDAALEYADRLIDPEGERRRGGPGPDRIVAVRERVLVMVEDGSAELAARVFRRVWSPSAPPRSYLAVRDLDGVAILGERRGPFAERVQRRLESVRNSGSTRVQWRNRDHTAFVFQGPTTRVELDASRRDFELVVGQSGGFDALRRRLDLLLVATGSAGGRPLAGSGPVPAGRGATGPLGEMDALLGR